VHQETRILVVDDEAVFARNVARLLEARGFQASVAFDGYTAIERLQTDADRAFHLVLLDVKMPGMGGNEVLSRIKFVRPDVEVIMLTGHGDVASGLDAIREGAFDYLLKPCDIDILTEKIQEAIAADEMKRQPILWLRKLVKEVTDSLFLPLETGDPLIRALEIFEADRDRIIKEELHVTDPSGRLAGIIRKNDLIQVAGAGGAVNACTWEELTEHPEWLPRMTVGEVMENAPEIHAEPDEPLTRVAERMIQNNLSTLPVINKEAGNRFAGVIHLKDVLDHAACKEEENDYI